MSLPMLLTVAGCRYEIGPASDQNGAVRAVAVQPLSCSIRCGLDLRHNAVIDRCDHCRSSTMALAVAAAATHNADSPHMT
jgi:hypothetical protein